MSKLVNWENFLPTTAASAGYEAQQHTILEGNTDTNQVRDVETDAVVVDTKLVWEMDMGAVVTPRAGVIQSSVTLSCIIPEPNVARDYLRPVAVSLNLHWDNWYQDSQNRDLVGLASKFTDIEFSLESAVDASAKFATQKLPYGSGQIVRALVVGGLKRWTGLVRIKISFECTTHSADIRYFYYGFHCNVAVRSPLLTYVAFGPDTWLHPSLLPQEGPLLEDEEVIPSAPPIVKRRGLVARLRSGLRWRQK